MKPSEFVHHHIHTDASFIDGLGSVENLMSHAKSLGFEAMSMTDHGDLTNTLRFIRTAKNNGIKPIIGLEGYVSVDNERFHITLLADGNKGFKNIVELNNIGVESNDKKPTFNIGDFKQHNEGVYLLTGCPQSPMQMENLEDSVSNFRYLKKIFGDRLFVEMMLVDIGGDFKPYDRAIQLSQDFNTPIIVTNDVHFADKKNADLHQTLLKMSGFTYDSSDLFLATPDELIERMANKFDRKDLLPYLIKGMRNSKRLADKLNTPVFNNKPKLPKIENADKKLWSLIEHGYNNRVKSGQIEDLPIYRDRYHYEYKIISSMGFSSYFMILHDILNYAHKHNVWIGGRGSGAGSLVLYLLEVTEIDPIKYNLIFERFLNPKRKDMPDVDVDLGDRDTVIQYAVEKYDAKPIATLSTYKYRSLLVDLSKQFDLDKNLLEKCKNYDDDNNEYFHQLKESNSDFSRMYEVMIGQYRHKSKHAGGVVINEDGFPLPLTKATNGQTLVSWAEGTIFRDLSDVGLVKFDLLGLKSGEVVNRLQNKLNIKPPAPIDKHDAYNMFLDGKISGVFQMDTPSNIPFCQQVKPDNFEDLIAINALCRPGPRGSGASDEYPEMKHNNTRRYLHPDIDDILKDTYGIICYQEQVMSIVAFLIDGDFGDADIARSVITKPKPNNPEWVKKLEKLKSDCYQGAKNKGWKEQEIDKVWGEIETHSEYSFNKSHSAIYARLTWQMLWFKYTYPVEYYTELLNVYSDNPELTEKYMFSAILEGIKISYPDINVSTNEYSCKDGVIYLPLTSVKYVSDSSYNKLITKRPFKSLEDYMERVPKSYVKKRGREGFLHLGVFDSIIGDSENPVELLGVDDNTLHQTQKQFEYLGYILPTKHYIEEKEYYENQGALVGVVSKVDFRNKGKGDYQVVWLNPSGIFWHKTDHVFEKGDSIAVEIDNNNGNMISWVKVNYE